MKATQQATKATHEVSHELFRGLMVCAVRYALPRHTYVVSEAKDWITALAHELDSGDLRVMRRDIQQTLEEHERDYRHLHECDRQTWQEMFEFIDRLLQTRDCTPETPQKGIGENKALSHVILDATDHT